jgi:hypothetical protein
MKILDAGFWMLGAGYIPECGIQIYLKDIDCFLCQTFTSKYFVYPLILFPSSKPQKLIIP